MNNRLPNLLIPGYHKSGTTTLFTELAKHPEICPSIIKEPFFFRPIMNDKPIGSIERYKKNWSKAKREKFLMEASPTYIYGGRKVALEIQKTLPNVKIILILRNPINHLFSIYKHKKRFMKIEKSETFLSFAEKLNNYSKQSYDEHLNEWFDVFGNNIKCIFFEEFIEDPTKVLNDIYYWLGLDKISMKNKNIKNVNIGKTYRYGFIQKLFLLIFKRLKKRFPHNKFLLARNLYYKINGKALNDKISNEALNYLNPIFQPKISSLKFLLENKGYENFPDWIKQSSN